jgi:hypothetical protein
MTGTISEAMRVPPRSRAANPGRARRGSALFILLLLVSLGVAAFDVYAVAIHAPQNSDAVQSFLEARWVLGGNVLLSGWHLTRDNFVFTDLPFFVAARWVFGPWPGSLAVVPALIYVLILGTALAAALDSLRLSGRNVIALAMIILLLGLPAAGPYLPMLVADTHAAGILLSLLAFLLLAALERAEHIRERPWTALALAATTYAAVAGDFFPMFYAVLPALLVLGIDHLLRPRRITAGMIAILVVASVLGGFTPVAIAHLGGFATEQTLMFRVVTQQHLGRAIAGFFFGLLKLAGADIFGKDFGKAGLIAGTVANTARLAGWCLGGVAVSRMILGRRRRAGIAFFDRLLLLSIAALTPFCILSHMFDLALSGTVDPFAGDAALRYLSPIVVFGAVLAARAGAGMVASLPTRQFRIVVAGALVTLTLGLAAGHSARMARLMAVPPWTADNPFVKVATVLEQRHLTYGTGEYWVASIVTALTQGKVAVRAVQALPGGRRLQPYLWLATERWYDPARKPMFVIWRDGDPWHNVNASTVTATYGAPARIIRVDDFEIAILHRPPK